MARKPDPIVVVDVESICWATSPPEREENEIGMYVVDLEVLQRSSKHNILGRLRSTSWTFRMTTDPWIQKWWS